MLVNPIDLVVGAVAEPLSVTANGTYTAPAGTAYSPVTVNVPSGGEAEPERDVNFIDYDGTIVHSYTAAEFAELTALPANPSHNGLTAQGWNWTLADAKAYVADYGKLWVGQMYTTSDGKTRLYINLEEGRLAPYLGVAVNGSVDVDWGDGSTHDTVTGEATTPVISLQHTYAAAGEYVIALTVTGSMTLPGDNNLGSRLISGNNDSVVEENRAYQNALKKAEIGENCTAAWNAFANCYSLTSVTVPDGWEDFRESIFRECYCLKSMTIPSGVTSLEPSAFNDCRNLKSIAISKSVTSISNHVFYGCTGLASVTIPDSVTDFMNNAFNLCTGLASVRIPESITGIKNYMFSGCKSLASVIIPESVTDIGSFAFYNCYGLGYIKFRNTYTPPNVLNSNAWTNLPTDCVIRVPYGTLESYQWATNYPNPYTYTYEEYDPYE